MSLRLPLQTAFPTGGAIDFELLKQCIHKYGPVPRNVYAAYLGDGTMGLYDNEASQAIVEASKSFTELEWLIRSAPFHGPSTMSHKLVCMWRANPEIKYTNEDFGQYVACLSPAVLEKLLQASAFESLKMKRKVCEILAGTPKAGAIRSHAFEHYAHACLSSDEPLEEFNVYPLRPTSAAQDIFLHHPSLGSTPYTRTKRPWRTYPSVSDFDTRPAEAAEYCVPAQPNNPGFNSFVVTPNAVHIFQMTVSRTHTVDTKDQKGLQLLKKMVPLDRPWHYFVVVPQTTGTSFTLTSVHQDWVACALFYVMVLGFDVAHT